MEIFQLNQLLEKEKHELFLKEFSGLIETNQQLEIDFELYKLFQKIKNRDLLDSPTFNYFGWKLSLRIGKINQSEKCAEKYLKYLITEKRIFKLDLFLEELKSVGMLKNKIGQYKIITSALLGEKIAYKKLKENEEIFDWRKDHQNEMKSKILSMTRWDKEKLKLAYEYFLNFHFDLEIYLQLENVIKSSAKFYPLFLEFLSQKGIVVGSEEISKNENSENLNIDYDELAFELMSGSRDSSYIEQEKIIKSLELISSEELRSKGYEMLVAFRLLEMNKVVYHLAEILKSYESDISKIASIDYVKIQMMTEENKNIEAVIEIDQLLSTLPLLDSERIAFLNLKIELLDKENKPNEVKRTLEKIRMIDPGNLTLRQRKNNSEKNK